MIAYRYGSRTSDNLTPRLGKDTIGRPGQSPGVSLYSTPQAKGKSQRIDLTQLQLPLAAFPDSLGQGGSSGHFSIAPIDPSGAVDNNLLEQWALSRGSGRTHPLTQVLLDAIVGEVKI